MKIRVRILYTGIILLILSKDSLACTGIPAGSFDLAELVSRTSNITLARLSSVDNADEWQSTHHFETLKPIKGASQRTFELRAQSGPLVKNDPDLVSSRVPETPNDGDLWFFAQSIANLESDCSYSLRNLRIGQLYVVFRSEELGPLTVVPVAGELDSWYLAVVATVAKGKNADINALLTLDEMFESYAVLRCTGSPERFERVQLILASRGFDMAGLNVRHKLCDPVVEYFIVGYTNGHPQQGVEIPLKNGKPEFSAASDLF